MQRQWKENSPARAIQKENIQKLLDENQQLLTVISSLKPKLKEAKIEYEKMFKSVKMLNSGTNSLNQILNTGKNSSNKHGLGYNSLKHAYK